MPDSAEKTSIAIIEKTLEKFFRRKSFSCAEAVAAIADPAPDGLAERVKRLLDSDDRLFAVEMRYFPKKSFFKGKKFLVTPTEEEIDEGLLVPGHRFAAFTSPEVFPSEVELKEDGTAIFPLKTIDVPLEKYLRCHLLLGAEQLSDYLIAEDAENKARLDQKGAAAQVKLRVFDLKKFYRKHNFSSGDALVCTIADWGKGIIACSYQKAAERPADETYYHALSQGLDTQIAVFDDMHEIPEQLGWAHFFADAEVLENPALSLDEFFLSGDSLYEIDFSGSYSTLVRAPDDSAPSPESGHTCECGHSHDAQDPEDEEEAIPDLFSLDGAAGESLAIGKILLSIGSPLTPVEIDAYMLNAAYGRNMQFSDLFAELFGRDTLPFESAAAETSFLNYLEDRHERLVQEYDRVGDERKAQLREILLPMVEQVHSFEEECRELHGEKAQTQLKSALKLEKSIDQTLAQLNDPAFLPEEPECEKLGDEIAELQQELEDLRNFEEES
ncbi:MAG: hypothetical protein PHS41_06175 [Victivallaceae bacterium]|nr:hypothetical protein [Victivallaceae bacterium]